MKTMMISMFFILGCQTPSKLTYGFQCHDKNPYAEGACEFRAAFRDWVDCFKLMNVVSKDDKGYDDYFMCSLPLEED